MTPIAFKKLCELPLLVKACPRQHSSVDSVSFWGVHDTGSERFAVCCPLPTGLSGKNGRPEVKDFDGALVRGGHDDVHCLEFVVSSDCRTCFVAQARVSVRYGLLL